MAACWRPLGRGRRAALAALAGLAAACGPSEPDLWRTTVPGGVGLDPHVLGATREAALEGGGAGMVVRHERAALWWGDLSERFDVKSTTKSIGSLALGLAVEDGALGLDTRLAECARGAGLESVAVAGAGEGALGRVTLRQLASHSGGFAKHGGKAELAHPPGTRFAYSDGGPNWLADCITLATGRDIEALLFERVFAPLRLDRGDLRWRENLYRTPELGGVPRRELGAGVHANVEALALIGELALRGGAWRGEPLVPRAWLERATRPAAALQGIPVRTLEGEPLPDARYGLLWWSNAAERLRGVPRDAFWAWGGGDSAIAVVPSLDVVVARAGAPFTEYGDFGRAALERLLQPVVRAAVDTQPKSAWTLEWAPADSVRRRAEGSDTWPSAWADDGALYTAYADGWGFAPKLPEKLSLGFSRVRGGPDDFRGENLRSETGERRGDGPEGEKASGMLAVDGRLYVLVRNAGNARLGWSDDRARSWQWADWRFEESFGAPTFLQFGRDYAGARDRYVYVYSHDSDSAYVPADRMVLARVPRDRVPERAAWEFFAGLDAQGAPRWSPSLAERAAVFEHAGRCHRSGASYSPGLDRYLWCQSLPGRHARFDGGFGVYEAPEPWGPWRQMYATTRWDVGPGETCHFPPKWMGDDGRTLHMVFSGDDHFAVRRARVVPRAGGGD